MKTQAWIAEFIGTFALIFIGVGAIASNALIHGQSGLVGIALAHGLTIAVMVSATAAISGGHLNPAVTIGLLTAGKIDLLNAIGYVMAQCLGAISAAFLIKIIFPATILQSIGMGTPALGQGVTPARLCRVWNRRLSWSPESGGIIYWFGCDFRYFDGRPHHRSRDESGAVFGAGVIRWGP